MYSENNAYRKEIEYPIVLACLLLSGLAALFLFLLWATPMKLSWFQVPCWVHERTGMYCPGCGGTRAALALLRGQPLKSFCFHPVVPYTGIVFLTFTVRGVLTLCTKGKIPFMKFHTWYIYVGIAITLVQFLIKNAVLLLYGYTWL